MRILTLTRGFFPAVDFGGPAIAAHEITRRLAARGHDVTVYTSNLRDREHKLYPSTTEKAVDGVRVVYLNSVWDYNYAAVAPAVFRYCRREMRSFEVVNIYGLREFLTVVVAGYARRARVPFILQPLGNLPRYSRSVGLKLLFDASFGKSLLKGAARVVARSELEAGQIARHGVAPERIAIVPNGVALEEFTGPGSSFDFRKRFGIEASEKLVLYVGRLAAIKSLDLLIDAFAPLASRARLVLAGPAVETDYLARLQRQIARLGIAKRVTFTGPLEAESKAAAYRTATVFVLPSLFETYGLAAAEAIASGTPVIVTTGCGLAPIVRDRVGLVVEHEPEPLTAAIAKFISDDDFRRSLSERCVAVASAELSWEAAVDRLEAVFTAVVDERRSS